MKCPKCATTISRVEIKSIKVDRCDKCGGTWYDADELRLLKDKESRGDYRWIDLDLWKDKEKFLAGRQRRLSCPKDGQRMTTIRYGDFPIRVDICTKCRGIWLDEGEYKKILKYLEQQVNTETIQDYLQDLREEFLEIFTGPEGPISELADFTKVLYLLELRFRVEHPRIATSLQQAGRSIPGA